MAERREDESVTAFTIRRVSNEVIDMCANLVPTNWCDELLTGKDAARPPLNERGIEVLLRGIQDRIRNAKE